MLAVTLDMLSGADIIATDFSPIALEFLVEMAYAAGVLTDESAVPISSVALGTDADIFNDENINGLTTLMTPSKSSLSPLCEDSMSLC